MPLPWGKKVELIDVDAFQSVTGTTIFNVSQAAIGDFQLNRSTQDVSGDVTSTGQVLVSTNSGTNSIHGQAFYNFQDHRALFANTAGGIDTPFQRNQYGGSVGGPIIKDKLFFFGNAERIKQKSPVSITMAPLFLAIQQAYPREINGQVKEEDVNQAALIQHIRQATTLLWLILAMVWIVGALRTKRTVQNQSVRGGSGPICLVRVPATGLPRTAKRDV